MAANAVFPWIVHLYTASGAFVGFLALYFIEQGNFPHAFWLMSLAVFIDATDGTLARLARVKESVPWFDGDRLEDIVDYLNYVVVPCLFFMRADLVPERHALALAALVLLASAYGFCQKEAKTSDYFFLGFPSYWNIVAFYFYVLRTSPSLNAFLIVVFSVLVFVPIKYVYPSRTPTLRGLTMSLGVLWGILVLLTIALLPGPPIAIVIGSLVFPAYYLALTVWLAARPPS
jgi:phosphatidylcholine synthase